MTQLEIALSYAKNGIKVFPCSTQTKSPITRQGFTDATCDVEQITKWWTANPEAFIGAPNDDFLVIDFDTYTFDDVQLRIMAPVIQEIQDKILVDGQLMVKTKSGGEHYYFSNKNSVRRKIKTIAQIDVLGVGGYCILPDQKTYISNVDAPWDGIADLPDFDEEMFDTIATDNVAYTKAIKDILKVRKGTTTAISKEKKVNTKYNSDTKKYAEVEAQLRAEGVEGINMGIINYQSETVEFKIDRNLYKKTEKKFEKADSNADIFENGPLVPSVGDLNSDILMNIFHNRHTQKKLGEFMGLNVPSINSTTSIHSVLPNHNDEHKSMGVRWNDEGTHLLVRDFANHYTDVHCQNDYNLVRLYCVQQYNTNVPRLNGPEFTVWFTRMLVESGLMVIDHLKTPLKPVDKLHDTQKSVLESFQLLDAIKKTYDGYDGTTTFADKFSSAWTGLSPSTVNRTKKALAKKGLINIVGDFDCSGGKRDDNFFVTKLYKLPGENDKAEVVVGEQKVKLNEAVTPIVTAQNDEKEEQVQDIYPDMGTIVTLTLDHDDQDKITHFSEDFDIPNNPDYDNMFVPLFVSDKYEILDVQEGSTYYMDQLVLDIVEGSENQKLLIAYGTSPSIETVIEKLAEESESLLEDKVPVFVVSNNMEDVGDVDLDNLTLRFNEYMGGRISLSDIDVRYLNAEGIVAMMDGMYPSDD